MSLISERNRSVHLYTLRIVIDCMRTEDTSIPAAKRSFVSQLNKTLLRHLGMISLKSVSLLGGRHIIAPESNISRDMMHEVLPNFKDIH